MLMTTTRQVKNRLCLVVSLWLSTIDLAETWTKKIPNRIEWMYDKKINQYNVSMWYGMRAMRCWMYGRPFQHTLTDINWHLHIFQCKSMAGWLAFFSLLISRANSLLLNKYHFFAFSLSNNCAYMCVCMCVCAFFLLLLMNSSTNSKTHINIHIPDFREPNKKVEIDMHSVCVFDFSSLVFLVAVDTWHGDWERESERESMDLCKEMLSDWHRNSIKSTISCALPIIQNQTYSTTRIVERPNRAAAHFNESKSQSFG